MTAMMVEMMIDGRRAGVFKFDVATAEAVAVAVVVTVRSPRELGGADKEFVPVTNTNQ
jgi:hypothetical protein